MVKINLKEDIWLYPIIAVILLIISIFTPWGSLETAGVTAYSWMGGGVAYVEDPVDAWTGTGVSLWTLGLVMFSLGILLIYGLQTKKGKEFKFDWLVYLLIGLVLIIFPILALVLESTDGIIGFAPIGVILAGVVCIIAFVMEKIVAGRGTA